MPFFAIDSINSVCARERISSDFWLIVRCQMFVEYSSGFNAELFWMAWWDIYRLFNIRWSNLFKFVDSTLDISHISHVQVSPWAILPVPSWAFHSLSCGRIYVCWKYPDIEHGMCCIARIFFHFSVFFYWFFHFLFDFIFHSQIVLQFFICFHLANNVSSVTKNRFFRFVPNAKYCSFSLHI